MLRLFTDPHLGRKAGAHTSGDSSKALDKRIFDACRVAATTCKEEDQVTICAGDLFDRTHNSEGVIAQGIAIAECCDLILGGNHDEANRADVKSSMELLQEVTEDKVIRIGVSGNNYEVFELDHLGTDYSIVMVPHHSSQDLFEDTLARICANEEGHDMIILHCNFDNPFATNDASLNLTREIASYLLKSFKYIVLGHEHNHRWEMDNRLLILGNTHPTNFGDISTKYYWDYDPIKKEFNRGVVWDRNLGYKRITIKQALEGYDYGGENFVEITGSDVDPELASELSKAIKSIWDQNQGELFMVRNSVEFKKFQNETVDKSVHLENVTAAISEKLKGSSLSEMWEKHLEVAKQ